MSIIRVKSKNLNKLNESLQRISLFEDDLKKSDIQKDDSDNTFFTDIETDNEETVVNNLNDDDDITVLDSNDSPETKRQKLISDFTNALSSEMELNKRLQKIIKSYAEIQNDMNESDKEWVLDKKKHDIYLKDKDAHIFRQNRNICLTYNQRVKTFNSEEDLNNYLIKHNFPTVNEELMQDLVESVINKENITLTEAPFWSKMAKAADKVKDWGKNFTQKTQQNNEIDPQDIWDAVVEDHTNFIKACVKHNIDMNVPEEKSGQTPLMYAAEKGMKDMVDIISEDKNTLNVADKDGWTPLMYGMLPNNRQEIMTTLLDKGADATAETKEGETVSDLAQKAELPDAVDVLEKHNIEVTKNQPVSPDELVKVIKSHDSAALDEILQRPDAGKIINSPINKTQETPLMLAAATAKSYDVKKLLDAGGDINIKDKNFRTPVIYAAASTDSDPETIQVLKDAGANLDSRDKEGKSANDYLNMKFGDNKNTNTNSQNQASSEAPKAKTTDKKAQAKDTSNEPEEDEEDEVDYAFDDEEYDAASEIDSLRAVNKNRLDITKTLVNHGNANVNAVDPETGESPLDQADSIGDTEMSDFLKSKGAQNSVDYEDEDEEEEETQANESISDFINSYKNRISLNEEDKDTEEKPVKRTYYIEGTTINNWDEKEVVFLGRYADLDLARKAAKIHAENPRDYYLISIIADDGNMKEREIIRVDSDGERILEPEYVKMAECIGGAGVTTASFAPAVTQTVYSRPKKKKK